MSATTTTYLANPTHVGAGRPPCANCGASYRVHLEQVAGAELQDSDTVQLRGGPYLTARGRERLARAGLLSCPEAYRPDNVEAARRELEQAQAAGDEARIFVARGNLQRLEGRPASTG